MDGTIFYHQGSPGKRTGAARLRGLGSIPQRAVGVSPERWVRGAA